MTIEFKYSLHAQKKMDSLGIMEDEIRTVVIKGSKWKENDVLHSRMGGIEVVYKRVKDVIFVITVYYA